MAGDWTKMRDDLADDPAVFGMSLFLAVDVDMIVGKLLRVWSWAGRHTMTGRIVGANRALIDQIARMERFTEALERFEWISVDDYGATFPKWSRHNSKSAKRRALEQRRKSASRADKKRTQNGHNADQKRGEERRREEKRKETPIPPALDTPDFHRVWSDWQAHRVEIKKALTPTQAAKQLRRLEGLGVDRAVAVIEHTIAQGWQGLREPNGEFKADPASKLPTPEEDANWTPEGGIS